MRAPVKWIGLAIAALAIVAASLVLLAPVFRSFVKNRIVDTLSANLDSEVEVGDLQIALVPHISIHGQGLILHHKRRRDVPPLIRIGKFSAEAGLLALLRSPAHIFRVHLDGLEIHVPPKGSRANGVRAEPAKRKAFPVVIDELIADKTELKLLRKDSAKEPLEFGIHELTMHSIALDRPAPFRAKLSNPKPRGEIETVGQFGPWNREEPSETPLAATYAFTNADLSTFRGIAGILASTGQFGGTLDTIYVQGKTSTPDFRTSVAGHPVPLETRFDGVVDGTNGNTSLTPVRASFRRSSMIANGGVARNPGVKGRTVFLDVVAEEARLEDLLRLAAKADRPAMTGSIRFRAKLELPPGEADVVERLKLDGQFGIGAARFTNLNVREKVRELSRKAEGEPENKQAGSSVLSLAGRFRMSHGVLSFSNLTFEVEGASVRVDGT
ncbi:MAG: hypothetical protein M3Z36_04450, partial [Acidobacteriota bacterium]|nr:hypothetical protein [Acidobacteriota bacterium]